MAMVGVSSHYGRTCGPTQLTVQCQRLLSAVLIVIFIVIIITITIIIIIIALLQCVPECE